MMNRVILVGRLTKDPDLRYTPNGVAVATFTLAVNRPFTNQQGEREADFINCVIWRKQAENVANFLKKGSLAGVDGRIQTRNYEDNDTGKRVYITEVLAESVQFLEPRGEGNGNGGNNGGNRSNNGNGNGNRNNGNGGNRNNNGGNNGGNRNNGNGGNYNNNNNNYSGNDNGFDGDPFANGNGNGQIDISDDDLPF